jgi:hypothetical protein
MLNPKALTTYIAAAQRFCFAKCPYIYNDNTQAIHLLDRGISIGKESWQSAIVPIPVNQEARNRKNLW